MREDWRLPEQARAGWDWTIDSVLVEYDGPQVVLLRRDGGKALAVLADMDEAAARWVHAPISRTEERAIRAGAASLRSALLKPGLEVTDVDLQGNARRSWTVDSGDLTDEQLPEPGATLPGSLPGPGWSQAAADSDRRCGLA